MIVLGFDLALIQSGWALVDSRGPDEVGLWKIPTSAPFGMRLDCIAGRIKDITATALRLSFGEEVHVFIEGPVGASYQVLKLAPVHGVAHQTLWWAYELVAQEAPAKSVKVLATNNGNADKAAMVEAARLHLGYTGTVHDEADALWVADYGARVVGLRRPTLPPGHLRALPTVCPGG